MATRINDKLVTIRKECRAEILAILDLNRAMEQPMRASLIESALRRKPELADEVCHQLYYLRSKGYIDIVVEEETPELRPIMSAYILLTGTGQDVAEGTLDDPGLIFGDGGRA